MEKRYSSAQQRVIAALRAHGELILHDSGYWTKKNPKLKVLKNRNVVPLLRLETSTLNALFFAGKVRYEGRSCFLNS